MYQLGNYFRRGLAYCLYSHVHVYTIQHINLSQNCMSFIFNCICNILIQVIKTILMLGYTCNEQPPYKRAIRSIDQFSNFLAPKVGIKKILNINNFRLKQGTIHPISLTVYDLPIFVDWLPSLICSDFNCVRPTHFLIVCTLSENENNIFMA